MFNDTVDQAELWAECLKYYANILTPFSITEIFKSKAILVGSPTINRGVLTGIAALLEEIKGLKFKNKKAAVFGCYGWSGEGNKMLSENLRAAGFEVIGDGFRALWNPDSQSTAAAEEFGRRLVQKVYCAYTAGRSSA
jgi:anaerobic nitric oxide reductase flavorubredoxin